MSSLLLFVSTNWRCWVGRSLLSEITRRLATASNDLRVGN